MNIYSRKTSNLTAESSSSIRALSKILKRNILNKIIYYANEREREKHTEKERKRWRKEGKKKKERRKSYWTMTNSSSRNTILLCKTFTKSQIQSLLTRPIHYHGFSWPRKCLQYDVHERTHSQRIQNDTTLQINPKFPKSHLCSTVFGRTADQQRKLPRRNFNLRGSFKLTDGNKVSYPDDPQKTVGGNPRPLSQRRDTVYKEDTAKRLRPIPDSSPSTETGRPATGSSVATPGSLPVPAVLHQIRAFA